MFKDSYQEALAGLVEAKRAGLPQDDERPVTAFGAPDLFAALKKSLELSQDNEAEADAAPVKRKIKKAKR